MTTPNPFATALHRLVAAQQAVVANRDDADAWRELEAAVVDIKAQFAPVAARSAERWRKAKGVT